MRRALAMMLTASFLATACSGGGDTDVSEPDTAEAPSSSAESLDTVPAPTVPSPTDPSSTTATTVAPTTTIDAAAILANVEAAYLESFEVGNQILRKPLDPANEGAIDDHFVGPNREGAVEDLRRTVDGNFIAIENPNNPSFAVIVTPAEFVDGDTTLARLEVCEFNSDRIFEVGTAPDGGDALRRDDPISILITIRLQLVDGKWKSLSGTRGEEIRSEEEQCSDAE